MKGVIIDKIAVQGLGFWGQVIFRVTITCRVILILDW